MLLTVPSALSQSLSKSPILPLFSNTTRNRPSILTSPVEDAKTTRISSSTSSSSSSGYAVEDPKRRMRIGRRDPDRRKPSPLETRISLVLALASQAASLSQRGLNFYDVSFWTSNSFFY